MAISSKRSLKCTKSVASFALVVPMLRPLCSITLHSVCVTLSRRMIWCRFHCHLVCTYWHLIPENHLENYYSNWKWRYVPCSPLGFTFSFPMRQHSLNSATLAAWAKSFNLPTVIDQDVVEMLRDSLHKLGHNHIDVVAILNDTTSTLVIHDLYFVCGHDLTIHCICLLQLDSRGQLG